MTDTHRKRIISQWNTIPVPPPVVSGIHPKAGPNGAWLSISLEASDEPGCWLYFRDETGVIMSSCADDALPPGELQWEPVSDDTALLLLMREFAESFVESRGAPVECASPPCSMPPLSDAA